MSQGGLSNREVALHRLDMAEQILTRMENDFKRAVDQVHQAKMAIRAVEP